MEYIDGFPVTDHKVQFRGRVDLPDDEADRVHDGNVVCWIVRSRCRPPAYLWTSKDSEDRIRLSVQDVEAALPLAGDLRDSALAFLDRGDADQLFVDARGNVRFAFDEWDRSHMTTSIARLAAFLDERGALGEEDPVLTALGLLARLDPRVVAPSPIEVDVVSPYLNELSQAEPEREEGDVEVVGSIYRHTPSWMEDR